MNSANKRVRNPFDAALVENLHLPLIASPSLFQRPATPQLSSTQFEWTIEEVSSIKPAYVEPHETQFQDSPDPEYEAKAQMAISSYFKEHQIVPSPVNCSERQKRIILAEINGNTPIGKPGRRIRDFGTQTALSLPVDLPPELEEALRPYFQPQLAACYTEDGNVITTSFHDRSGFSSNSSGGAHNVSMRRKLFDMQNIIIWDENRKIPTPKKSQLNPSSQQQQQQQQQQLPTLPSIAGKLSDSLDKSSSDMILSPISGSDCLSASPHSPNNMQGVLSSDGSQNNCPSAVKQKRQNFDSKKYDEVKTKRRRSALFNPPDAEELSPIYPAIRNKRIIERSEDENVQMKDFVTPGKPRKANFSRRRLNAASATDEDDFQMETNSAKFTPDRSSSPLHSIPSSASACSNSADHVSTIATESFNIRVSRLAVNTTRERMISIQNDDTQVGEIEDDDDDVDGVHVDDEEAMQISQLSLQNSNLSNNSINSHCDTPSRKRRSASRKNLSRSFSANWQLDDDDDDDNDGNIDADDRKGYCAKAYELPNSGIGNDNAIKELVASGAKAIQPEIADYNTTVTTTIDNESEQTSSSSSEMQRIAQQQQSVTSYRTDSGFNEMTTSSLTTISRSSTLLHQDEFSREAFTFKSNEVSAIGDITGKRDHSASLTPYCSTPSKPSNDCRLPLATIGELQHNRE